MNDIMTKKTFRLFWETGTEEVISGEDRGDIYKTLSNAMDNAGIGSDDLAALDRWEEEEAKTEFQPTDPTQEQLEEWDSNGLCEAVCEHGCLVELDGYCEHDKPSWFLELCLI